MPSVAFILLVATLLPLIGFGVLLAVGKRMGNPLAGWLGTTLVGGSFLCSMLALFQWYSATAGAQAPQPWGFGDNGAAILLTMRWLPIGPPLAGIAPAPAHAGWLDVGLYIDGLTIAMFLVVTMVATLVHVFSIGYMRGDARFSRYFTSLGLFTFSMLGLVISGTLVQLFIFWELVGFCSYLLIGFWFERKAAVAAATKAFIVNRVGDAAFLVGFGLLFFLVGNATFPHVWAALGSAGQGGDVVMPSGAVAPAALMTAIGVCLFLGACGKSAQFPLHTWLPDAMQGPTPVSALIHAATMVAAGVYLVARMFPLLTPDAKAVIAIVGCITLAIGALIALVQTDIKQVLAWSTVSQLGYMMVAIGVGSWAGALFHLITHAFFKALLFLGAGSVIHAAHHEQDMRQYGGLMRRIPVTALCFGIAVLAISGAGLAGWGFSGFYSKANILTDAAGFAIWSDGHGGGSATWLLFAVPAAVAFITPFYMTRCWMLTFWGKPRNEHIYEEARETPLLYLPLLGLAAMSVIAGYPVVAARDLLDGARDESSNTVERLVTDAATANHADATGYKFSGWQTAWPKAPRQIEPISPDREPYDEPLTDAERAHIAGERMEHATIAWSWLIGIALAVAIYWRGLGFASAASRVAPIRWIHAWLWNRMYVDELYDLMVVRTVRALATLAGWIDRVFVDGAVNLSAIATERLSRVVGWNDRRVVDGAVTGVAAAAWQLGVAARAPQTGRVRVYVTALMAAVVIGLAVTIAIVAWQ